MREATPNPPHDARTAVAEVLSTAPDAAHPFLAGCADDLEDDDDERREGAARLLGHVAAEHPDECAHYAGAIRAAADRPGEFGDRTHRKLRAALEAVEATREDVHDSGGFGGDGSDVLDDQTSLRDFFPP